MRSKLSQRPCSGVKVPDEWITPPLRHSYKHWSSPPGLQPALKLCTQAGNWHRQCEELKDSRSHRPLSCQETPPSPAPVSQGLHKLGALKASATSKNTQIHTLRSSLKAKLPLPSPVQQSPGPAEAPEILEPVAFCNRGDTAQSPISQPVEAAPASLGRAVPVNPSKPRPAQN